MIIFYFLIIVFLISSRPFHVVSFSITHFCQLDFSLDYYSLIFTKVLAIISSSVLLWSYSYLGSEPAYLRFFFLILRFLFSIFLLIFATSLLSLFIGWDLLGFTSFFLVAFYGNQSCHSAAMLTGLSNRVGDCFFFLLIGICPARGFSLSWASFVLIVLVGITKSAQLPFSSWLPAAMFAPTPVRALVHSSTLVTAGVYLLFRFGPLHSESLFWIGVLTSLAGGYAAIIECDIKKVIAYSTLSQLGILMSGLGLGLRTLTYYHLLSHAVIKALMFVSIGILIHSYYGSQEARSCTRLSYASGLTSVILALRSIGLAGFTFTTGYYSKEPILESGYCQGFSLPCLIFLYFSFALTIGYLLRLCVVLGSVGVATAASLTRVGTRQVQTLSVCILLLAMLLQAHMLSIRGPVYIRLLFKSDKFLVFLALISGGVLRYCASLSYLSCLSPLRYLNASVLGYGVFSSHFNKSMFLEVSSLQAFSVGESRAVVFHLTSTSLITSKLLLFLILVFCLT